MQKKFDFGRCDKDSKDCYSKGCICRLNKIEGFQTEFNYSNPSVRFPFRNKDCSHFHRKEGLKT